MQRSLLPVFASAALVFVAYAAFVQLAPFTLTSGQNQGDTNALQAQDYLAAPDRNLVLVGSSLTFRVPAQALPQGAANLALAGEGAQTGLQIIRDAGASPRLVLIETNLLLHPVNAPLVLSLLRFPERPLRRMLRVFRTGYDPVNLLWRGFAVLMHKADVEPPMPPDVTRQLLQLQKKEKSRLPDTARVDENLARTASLVKALKAKGVAVGFFEMPIDQRLVHSPFDDALRREIQKAFPPDRFCWLALSIPGGAQTVDGIHLTLQDAALAGREISRQSGACLR